MSSNGVSIQDISGHDGHKSTHVTETVYRHVIVPASAAEQASWTTYSGKNKLGTAYPASQLPGYPSN
jgi:hypothetical protein